MPDIPFHRGAIDASACITNGWALVKPNYWMYFGIGLLAMVMVACVPCVNVIVMGPVTAGVYFVMLRAMRGEPVEFSMMFKGFEKFVPTMVIGIIQSVPGIIYQGVQFSFDIGRILSQIGAGSRRGGGDLYQISDEAGIAIAGGLIALYLVFIVGFIIFSIAWGVTFAFALPLAIEHGLGPVEAIKLSAQAGWSNVGGLIFLMVLLFLLAMAGVFALCVGVFFVIPIVYAAYAFAYRQVFPLPVQYAPPAA
jgi:uncharacterized membrane protein